MEQQQQHPGREGPPHGHPVGGVVGQVETDDGIGAAPEQGGEQGDQQRHGYLNKVSLSKDTLAASWFIIKYLHEDNGADGE
jgi:hypothetical protein